MCARIAVLLTAACVIAPAQAQFRSAGGKGPTSAEPSFDEWVAKFGATYASPSARAEAAANYAANVATITAHNDLWRQDKTEWWMRTNQVRRRGGGEL
jgi:hypothetical protein